VRRPDRVSTEALRGLAAIAADRTEGAHGLALRALRQLETEIGAWDGVPPQVQAQRLRRFATVLGASQPAMGSFRQWSADLEELGRRAIGPRLRTRARRWADRTRRAVKAEPHLLSRVVRERLPPGACVVTMSQSSTVREVLTGLPPARRPRNVVVLESLPGGEGRAMARELRAKGVRARAVPDRVGRGLVRSADVVLVSADAVTARGTVVHKVGTRTLAREARRQRVPFVVVAGRTKYVASAAGPRRLPRRFDRTPRALVSEYWTDGGVRHGGRVGRRRARR
jgi:translation initiation factor 2B subunit (eIF-2B alpha/beta/delta family)